MGNIKLNKKNNILIPPIENMQCNKDFTEQTYNSNNFVVNAVTVTGWRPSNEDRFKIYPKIKDNVDFVAVYDGVDGSNVSEYLSRHFHEGFVKGTLEKEDVNDTIITHCKKTDENIINTLFVDGVSEYCASTACFAFMDNDGNIIVGNLGNSRVVMARSNNKVLNISDEMTIWQDSERIKKNGGNINWTGSQLTLTTKDSRRGLTMARGFGAKIFKEDKPIISNVPKIQQHKIDRSDQYLVLATNGFWENFGSSLDAIRAINREIALGKNFMNAVKSVIDAKCFATSSDSLTGCDNITVIVIGILHDNTDESKLLRQIKHEYGEVPQDDDKSDSKYNLLDYDDDYKHVDWKKAKE